MHTSQEELRVYLEGGLSRERAAFIRSHIINCHLCGIELATALREHCKSGDADGLGGTNTENGRRELRPSMSGSIAMQRIRRSKMLSFRVSQGEYEDLLRISEERGVRISELARDAVQDLVHPRKRLENATHGLTEKVRTLDGRVEELDREVKSLVGLLIDKGAVSAPDLENMMVACGPSAEDAVANEDADAEPVRP